LIPALWSSSTLRRRAQRPSSGPWTRRRRSRTLSSRTLRRAALARKLREDVFSPEKHREAVEALDEDWETLDKPEVSEDLVREAGDLAEEHALRRFDAIHLASALLVHDAYSGQGNEETEEAVLFLGFDSNLTKAAGKVMQVYEPTEDPNDQNKS
jgi:hypothetical protein